MSPLIIIIAFSVVNKSYLNQKRNMHRSSMVYKQKQSKTVLNKYVGNFFFMWKDKRGWTFSLMEL